MIIKDEKGREIVKISDDGRIAVARFPDMSAQLKEYIVDLYRESTCDADSCCKRIEDFLEYRTEDNQFCV